MKIKVNGNYLYFDVYGSALSILPDKVINKPTLIVFTQKALRLWSRRVTHAAFSRSKKKAPPAGSAFYKEISSGARQHFNESLGVYIQYMTRVS